VEKHGEGKHHQLFVRSRSTVDGDRKTKPLYGNSVANIAANKAAEMMTMDEVNESTTAIPFVVSPPSRGDSLASVSLNDYNSSNIFSNDLSMTTHDGGFSVESGRNNNDKGANKAATRGRNRTVSCGFDGGINEDAEDCCDSPSGSPGIFLAVPSLPILNSNDKGGGADGKSAQ
jgi:hypothetical protein